MMLYSSETCVMEDNDVKRLEHAEESMMRWMYITTVRNSSAIYEAAA